MEEILGVCEICKYYVRVIKNMEDILRSWRVPPWGRPRIGAKARKREAQTSTAPWE